ncbi:MAG TPA: hypothetical protein VMG60_19365 [Burkholderiaceae bacterium]|nr:hypothetical protein [Burkholderiaceae bacterium]
MSWLGGAYRRCIEWVWKWLRPAGLILRRDELTSATAQRLSTGPNARVETTLWIRQETPPGIARLAAILSAYARDPSLSPRSGLAGRPAGDA